MSSGILLLGNHPPPFGGVPTHVEALARQLAARGHEVHVVSHAPAVRAAPAPEGYTVHRPDRITRRLALLRTLPPGDALAAIAYLRAHPRGWLSALALYAVAAPLIRRHGIGLVSAYHLLPAAAAGAWLSRRFGLRFVATVFGEIYDDPARHRAALPVVRMITERADWLMSCSRHCARSLELLGLAPPVDVVHYGADLARFAPPADREAARRAAGAESGDRLALFVGRMVPEMGLGVLLDAVPTVLTRLPAARIVIAGTRGSLTASAARVAEAWPGRVSVRPDVPGDALPLLYGAADVVVAPSTNARACYGLAIAEALASGVPVIGCRVGGTMEVLEDGATGILIPPADAAALAAAMVALLGDDARRRDLAARARASVQTGHDAAVATRRVADRFHTLLRRAD